MKAAKWFIGLRCCLVQPNETGLFGAKLPRRLSLLVYALPLRWLFTILCPFGAKGYICLFLSSISYIWEYHERDETIQRVICLLFEKRERLA